MAYDVSNPHPLFGKDPNIINEYGHTTFPMYVDSKDKDDKGKFIRVVVNDAKEFEEVTGKKFGKAKAEKPEGWDK